MKLLIDTEILEKNDISLQEFAVILYCLEGNIFPPGDEVLEGLWKKGYLIKEVGGFKLDNNKLSFLSDLLTEAFLVNADNKDEIMQIAEEMRSLFPEGKKEGTPYYWKDSKNIIAKRLATLIKKYNIKYTKEEIIEATRSYIQSFNGNYQYMQLLKYFIYKKNNEGEFVSQLLSYMENKDQTSNNDWTSELV